MPTRAACRASSPVQSVRRGPSHGGACCPGLKILDRETDILQRAWAVSVTLSHRWRGGVVPAAAPAVARASRNLLEPLRARSILTCSRLEHVRMVPLDWYSFICLCGGTVNDPSKCVFLRRSYRTFTVGEGWVTPRHEKMTVGEASTIDLTHKERYNRLSTHSDLREASLSFSRSTQYIPCCDGSALVHPDGFRRHRVL